MSSFENILIKAVKIMNGIAGWALGLCMLLITANVILRKIFSFPILGTYEWVGILTAVMIGTGLSFCAYNDAHITIDFVFEKFKPGLQKVLGIITGVLSFSFMVLVSVALARYAIRLASNGEVTATSGIPFFIFVLMVAFGFVFLSAVILLKLIRIFKGGTSDES